MKRSNAVWILLVCLTMFFLAGEDFDVTRTFATSASVRPVSRLDQTTINISAPDVVFLDPKDSMITENSTVTVRVLIRSRIPLINIVLDVNGTGLKFKSDASTGDRYIFEREIKLTPGRNRIEVTALNEKATSAPAALTIFYEPNQQAKPDLYVLAIGVSRVDQSGLTAKTAALDTAAFSKLMGTQKREDGLFGNVEIITLIDEKATREAILIALDQLRERKKSDNDVTIVFITGNLAIDYFDNSIYFLTANYQPKVNLVVNNIRYSLFWEYLSSIRGQTVIFANTGWGNDGGKYPFERFANAEKGEVNSFFSSHDGAASMIDANSGYSVFTLALLNGLNGRADRQITDNDAKDRIVDTHELQQWVRGIYTLTNGRQLPVVQVRPRPLPIFKF